MHLDIIQWVITRSRVGVIAPDKIPTLFRWHGEYLYAIGHFALDFTATQFNYTYAFCDDELLNELNEPVVTKCYAFC